MEKRILILANNDGLPGVKVDVENYSAFFQSHIGGQWYNSEIITKLNPTRAQVATEITRLKNLNLDYAIVVFSGHGGQARETLLEINESGEKISESDIRDIASRQLTIYDCCRCYPQSLMEGSRGIMETKFFATVNTRARYEARIMQAIPQQARLYACSIGEKANDTSKGGVYSKYFLQCAKQVGSTYKTVGSAHVEAATLTTTDFNTQNPDSVLPRCFTDQQLIISINP